MKILYGEFKGRLMLQVWDTDDNGSVVGDKPAFQCGEKKALALIAACGEIAQNQSDILAAFTNYRALKIEDKQREIEDRIAKAKAREAELQAKAAELSARLASFGKRVA